MHTQIYITSIYPLYVSTYLQIYENIIYKQTHTHTHTHTHTSNRSRFDDLGCTRAPLQLLPRNRCVHKCHAEVEYVCACACARVFVNIATHSVCRLVCID